MVTVVEAAERIHFATVSPDWDLAALAVVAAVDRPAAAVVAGADIEGSPGVGSLASAVDSPAEDSLAGSLAEVDNPVPAVDSPAVAEDSPGAVAGSPAVADEDQEVEADSVEVVAAGAVVLVPARA